MILGAKKPQPKPVGKVSSTKIDTVRRKETVKKTVLAKPPQQRNSESPMVIGHSVDSLMFFQSIVNVKKKVMLPSSMETVLQFLTYPISTVGPGLMKDIDSKVLRTLRGNKIQLFKSIPNVLYPQGDQVIIKIIECSSFNTFYDKEKNCIAIFNYDRDEDLLYSEQFGRINIDFVHFKKVIKIWRERYAWFNVSEIIKMIISFIHDKELFSLWQKMYYDLESIYEAIEEHKNDEHHDVFRLLNENDQNTASIVRET